MIFLQSSLPDFEISVDIPSYGQNPTGKCPIVEQKSRFSRQAKGISMKFETQNKGWTHKNARFWRFYQRLEPQNRSILAILSRVRPTKSADLGDLSRVRPTNSVVFIRVEREVVVRGDIFCKPKTKTDTKMFLCLEMVMREWDFGQTSEQLKKP